MKRYLIPFLLLASAALAQPPHPMPPPVADQGPPPSPHPHAEPGQHQLGGAVAPHHTEAEMLLWQREIAQHEADLEAAITRRDQLTKAQAEIETLKAAHEGK